MNKQDTEGDENSEPALPKDTVESVGIETTAERPGQKTLGATPPSRPVPPIFVKPVAEKAPPAPPSKSSADSDADSKTETQKE